MANLPELADRIRSVLNVFEGAPGYVIRQVGALIGDGPIAFMDGSVLNRDEKVGGTLVTFTATTVMRTEWRGERGAQIGAQISSAAWSRRQLVCIELGAEKNLPDVWEEDWADQWPRGSSVDLVYQNSERLSLPLGQTSTYTNAAQHRKKLLLFVSELMNDLR